MKSLLRSAYQHPVTRPIFIFLKSFRRRPLWAIKNAIRDTGSYVMGWRHSRPERTQLNYYRDSWPLIVEWCPCDVHFAEYLQRKRIQGRSIFHFGSGQHHILGKTNRAMHIPNEILAITASKNEYNRYIDFVIKDPVAGRNYKVLFADIYTLSPRALPNFDLVTLFHLCEFYDESRSSYAQLDDSSLLELFLSKLNHGGKLFFYTGSVGFNRASTIIKTLVQQYKMIRVDDYKTLVVYERTQQRSFTAKTS